MSPINAQIYYISDVNVMEYQHDIPDKWKDHEEWVCCETERSARSVLLVWRQMIHAEPLNVLHNNTQSSKPLVTLIAVAFSDQQLTGLALLHAPTVRTATRASLLLALCVWNSLPSYLRQDISHGQLERKLKTFLFRRQLTDAHWDCFHLFLWVLEVFLLTY